MEQVYKKKESCCGCSACSAICPQSAIKMIPDTQGFMYPKIDPQKCIDCGLCVKMCGFNKKRKTEKNDPIVYAAINKNKSKRMCSSSGGIFIEFAQAVIAQGGCVYGAEFDEEFNVIHERETDLEGCRALQGSKYVQSDIRDCYGKIQKDLSNDKMVLFVGVPCQVGGLKAFLQKDYDNLYLIDLACHGVVSPKVWSSYKKKLTEDGAFKGKIKSVTFRDKSNGWKKYGFKIEFESGSYTASQDSDPYFALFLDRIAVRASCFNCPYNNYLREGDVTLADFWGIEVYKPHLDDNKGTSVILVNTKKGEGLFDRIRDNIIYEESNTKECLQGPFKSCMHPNKRSEKFWKDFNKNEYKAIGKYGKRSLKRIMLVRYIIPILREMGLYKFAIEVMGKRE